ncbi:MAG: hypothetical protein Q8P41_11885 [Pseudomonadota bacterium]|nr:hypothetical protein [Pseudomonadota bacterium]
MFASSLAVVLLTLAALLGAIVAFAWAWRKGHFHVDARAATLPFDDHDQRVARPWETPSQARERVQAHGPPLPPGPGEWGGA